jgi:predicted alpha-1,6-mannanase (GH76 family)
MAPTGGAAIREDGNMAEKAKPQVTGFLQSAAQQADKIDWKIVGAFGTVIGGIAVINGMRHRRWRYIHTLGVVLGIAAAIAPRLIRIFGGAARTPKTG